MAGEMAHSLRGIALDRRGRLASAARVRAAFAAQNPTLSSLYILTIIVLLLILGMQGSFAG